MKTVKIAAFLLSFSLLVPVLSASSQGSAYAQVFGDSDTEGLSEVDPTNSDSGTNGFSREVNPTNRNSETNDFSPEVNSSNSDDEYEYGIGPRVDCDDIANGIIQGAAGNACSDAKRGIPDLNEATDNAFPTNNIRDTADQFDLDPLTIETPNNPNSSGIINLDSSSALDPTRPDSIINDVLSEVNPIKLDSVINDVFSEVVPTNPNDEYGSGTRVACGDVANGITEGAAGTACSDAEQGIPALNEATNNASTTNSIGDAAEQFAPSAVDPMAPDAGINNIAPSAVDPMNPDAGINNIAPSAVDPMAPDAGINNIAPSAVDPMNPDAGINAGSTDIDPMNPNAGINLGLTDVAPMNPNAGINPDLTDIDPMNPDAQYGDGTTAACDAVPNSYTSDAAGTACSDADPGI